MKLGFKVNDDVERAARNVFQESEELNTIIMKTKFDDWKEETQALADWFIKKLDYDKDDCWWVGDEIGGVLCCDQYFFCLDRIVEFFRYGATVDQLYEYYDYEISHYENTDGTKPPPINFRNFVKYGALEKELTASMNYMAKTRRRLLVR